MAAIAPLTPDSSPLAADPWPRIAASIRAWAQAGNVALRDAVLLLPFAQLLAPARRGFAVGGGWMPRIETTQTLARSLAPLPAALPHEIGFDPVLDALRAAQMLRAQPTGAAWARRDPAGFRRAVGDVVEAAHAFAHAAAALPPQAREAHWESARGALIPAPGPGGTERWLARVALEWAAATPRAATDRLHALRPSAWIVLQAGGPDALALQLMANAPPGTPCALLDTDVAIDDPFADAAAPTLAVCDGFEAEAQAAAAQVLAHLQAGQAPVALIAQDRELVRRIRALLERSRVLLQDETGWTLSTTRAAAQVRRLLESAAPDAPTDALIDWLKSVAPRWPGGGMTGAVETLESVCRRRPVTCVAGLAGAQIEGSAALAWERAAALLQTLAKAPPRASPAVWLERLHAALRGCGALAALQDDAAGRQVLRALWLDAEPPALLGTDAAVPMALSEFTAWVGEVLEQRRFVPELAEGTTPEVVVTPLARAMLRPFAAVVFPGADDRHLGGSPAALALLSDAQAQALALPDAQARRTAELLAFAQVLRLPRLTLLRRRTDGAQPLAPSPLVERLGLTLARRGAGFAAWQDPRPEAVVDPTPRLRSSAPSAAGLLPQRISASACEALRACPYRFFALHMLGLREQDELDGEIEKRDYGNWLHAVLHAFHRDRAAPAPAAIEIERLHAAAHATRVAQGLDEAEFLPYWASFESFAPRYVAWLHRRDEAGATFRDGELKISVAPPALDGVELYGVVDRIDEVALHGRAGLELIDYKTGSAETLKQKVREPLEDTQLAFYAALTASDGGRPMRAIYLAVDGTRQLEGIEHPDVADSAAALVDGLANDLRRLRGGAALPALGEGITCDFCEARGICRRDHWSEPPP